MKFSIITPTLQRESLRKACESVNSQTHTDWEHIVMVDCEELKDITLEIEHPNRKIILCIDPHKNYGNTCRHNAMGFVTGDYVLYLDDDNWLADENILKDIAKEIIDLAYIHHIDGNQQYPPWCLFPILRHGHRFYTDPPRSCHVDTANLCIRREYARWPDGPQYTMDGIFCDQLVVDHPNYVAFPDFRPIVVMPSSSEGK